MSGERRNCQIMIEVTSPGDFVVYAAILRH